VKWLKDRLLLAAAAATLGIVLVGGGLLLERLRLGPWVVDLWIYTVLFFLVIVVTGISELHRRKGKLRRVWPLVTALATLLVGHAVTVGWLMRARAHELRMPETLVATYIEVFLFVVILERVYGFCTKRPTPQRPRARPTT
jgi:hypothetical protein